MFSKAFSDFPCADALKRATAATTVASLLAGCMAAAPMREEVVKDAIATSKGPEAKPFRTITNFSDGLRCMDRLMIDHGVRDVVVLIEDLNDSTKKINVGAKDMLITAVSDMTRRSRAIRLIAFGNDSGNLVSWINAAGKNNQVYTAVVPKFDIRGSITQMDDNISRQNESGGLSIGNFSLGKGVDASASSISLDLSMISTDTMELVPGVTSRNSAVIVKQGTGSDVDATIRKLGISYSFSVDRNETAAAASRNLVEMAAIELFGRLLHVPYWNCLGMDPRQAEIQNEMSDWFYTLSSNNQLHSYLQQQLRLRRVYEGPVDGSGSSEYDAALERARRIVGLNGSGADYELFAALLNTPREKFTQAAAAAPATVAARPSGPIELAISTGVAGRRHKRNEPLAFSVKPASDAYVYCYYKDDANKIQRIFPNRFTGDARVAAGRALSLPGSMKFRMNASAKGAPESLACFASDRDVLAELPADLRATDFENLAVASLDPVRKAFKSAARASYGEAVYTVEVQ